MEFVLKRLPESLKDEIIFTGYQSDTAKFYSIFDVFSLVSAYQAFGLVLTEVMMHKLPVVVTREGGMQYIVDENATGYLVAQFDVGAIAERLIKLYNDSGLRKQMGIKG